MSAHTDWCDVVSAESGPCTCGGDERYERMESALHEIRKLACSTEFKLAYGISEKPETEIEKIISLIDGALQ